MNSVYWLFICVAYYSDILHFKIINSKSDIDPKNEYFFHDCIACFNSKCFKCAMNLNADMPKIAEIKYYNGKY